MATITKAQLRLLTDRAIARLFDDLADEVVRRGAPGPARDLRWMSLCLRAAIGTARRRPA